MPLYNLNCQILLSLFTTNLHPPIDIFLNPFSDLFILFHLTLYLKTEKHVSANVLSKWLSFLDNTDLATQISNGMIFYFCFIDHARVFDGVDHNKLWKIIQEMGVPDPLTCLLRNLYAGQEETEPDMEKRRQQQGSDQSEPSVSSMEPEIVADPQGDQWQYRGWGTICSWGMDQLKGYLRLLEADRSLLEKSLWTETQNIQ